MRKLLIAAIVLILIVSSAISMAAVSAVMHRRSHADLYREAAWQQARAEYVLAAQVTSQRPAQVERGPVPPEPPEPPEPPVFGPDEQFDEDYWRARDAFRIGQALRIAPEDVVRDAVVIFGDATVAGRVRGDLIVIFGNARVEGTAQIEGDFVVIGGSGTVQPGATAQRDAVVIGGTLDAPPGFSAGGGHIVIGSQILGGSLTALAPYVSRGLLWGRVIVPDLPWVWGVLLLFFLLYAALNLVFDRPVLACATTLRKRPLTAFGAGLLVLLLIGPVCLLLVISVIGIAVVPFVICALIAAGLIGKVALARWIGMSAVAEDPDGNRAHAARSFVLGFAVLSIAYMIPVLGIISWAIGSVMGLGSAAMSFMAAYRRENPAKTPAFVPPRPPAVPPSGGTMFPSSPSTANGLSAASATPAEPGTPPIEAAPGVPPPPYSSAAAAPAASMPFAAAAGFSVGNGDGERACWSHSRGQRSATAWPRSRST